MLLLHLPKNRSQMQNERQYERERKDKDSFENHLPVKLISSIKIIIIINVELEKQLKDRLEGTVAVSEW